MKSPSFAGNRVIARPLMTIAQNGSDRIRDDGREYLRRCYQVRLQVEAMTRAHQSVGIVMPKPTAGGIAPIYVP